MVLAVAATVCIALGTTSPAVAADGEPLANDSGTIVAPDERRPILHGVNVVYKHPPFLPPEDEFGAADADAIAALGFNTVRLGFIWEGMQPERPEAGGPAVDEAYLDRYAELVELLTSRGIYVLIDSHQDLYSSVFGGEGAPPWAVLDYGFPYFPGISYWSANYFFQPAIWLAFESFWTNRAGIQHAYIDMWRVLAERFAGNPMVLGYEIMNEPWPGTDFLNGTKNAAKLESFYRQAIEAIRTVDDTHMIFWEPPVTSQLGVKSPITDLGAANLALSFHVYCPFTIARIFTVANGLWFAPLCESPNRSAIRGYDAARVPTDSAWILTEFGATDVVTDVALTTALADDFLVGWMYWSWKQYDDPTGDPNEGLVVSDSGPIDYKAKVRMLDRTFARMVAGDASEMSFDPYSGRFEFAYEPDHSIDAPTEIWVAVDRHYPDGYSVEITGGTASSSGGNIVLVDADPGAATVAVEITAN